MAKKQQPQRPQVKIARLEPGQHPAEWSCYEAAWRPIYCAGFDLDENGERQYHHLTNKKCDCKPGPHFYAQFVAAHLVDELALVGGRGSGKSELGLALLLGGHPGVDPYIYNKNYKALVLRRNSKDLHDWFTRAKEFFGLFGAVAAESPTMKLTFPSGAQIVCDHLADEDAYQKYQGHEYAIILIEECTQIPTESLYQNIRRSNRVKDGLGMKARMIVLANPDGPGLGWFIKRFIKLRHALDSPTMKGISQDQQILAAKRFPTGVPVGSKQIWNNMASGETRMFIHSTIYDNPYFLTGNAAYLKQLEGIDDETERRRWLLGDFTALIGQYFPKFRPDGPFAGEPPNARHVFPADKIKIEPWWPRLMGMDVGFRHHAAVYKAALSPDGRLIIYDEMVEAEVDNEEWGLKVATWCQSELPHLPSRSIPLFISHDAFGNRGEGRTIAEQISAGLRMVLGSTGASLVRPLDADAGESSMSDDQFFRLIAERQAPRIIVRQPFTRKRVDGWSFIRILMKWTGAAALDAKQINPDHVRRLAESGDPEAVNEYLRSFQVNHGEVLPRLVISDKCRLLIQALPTLVYDTGGKNPEDVRKTETIEDDVADAFRYLCTSYRKIVERIPRSVFAARAREEAQRQGVSDTWMYHHLSIAAAAREQEMAASGPFAYGLGSSRTRGVRRIQ